MVSLFAFDVVSSDPDFIETQWEALLAGGLDRELTLKTKPRAGRPCEVQVHLEKVGGASAGYIAAVRLRSPESTAPATPTAVGAPQAGEKPARAPVDDAESSAVHLLLAQSAVGFFDLQLKAGRYYFSPGWKKLLGYTASELPDTMETWHRLIHPDDSAAAPDKLARKISTESRPFNLEFRMRHRRGHWTWIQCLGVQLLSPSGELERVVGLHLDISDRKEIEDGFVANDARLQDLSTSGPLGAFELDFAGNLFWFSPAFERLLGYDEGELAREPASFVATLPPEDASAGLEAWLLARGAGQPEVLEAVRLQAKSGTPVPVLLGLHRSVTRRRELLRVVGFACALPVAAAEVEPLLPALRDAAFEALAEGIIISDARGKILYANSTATRSLHVSVADIRGRRVADVLKLINRLSHKPAEDPVERALVGDKPLPLINADALAPATEGDAPTPVVWTARPAYGSDGQAVGVVVVFRNPEEMTLTPDELVKANRLEELGLLAGGIAHDFNNILTTILGGVSLAKDNHDDSVLGDAEKACLAAKSLTKQLLAFAKGDTGTQTVCELKSILQDSIKLAAAGSTAVVTVDVPEGVHAVLVDRAQMLQVFQNLMVNALQAMPEAPHQPRLQIRAGNTSVAENQVPGLAPGEYVEVEVRDNGTGIKPEYIDKIFDPFFTTKKHGTGLGLATVLSLVRKHGGQIGLDTLIGVGTAFTVYLPKAKAPVEIQARRAASLRFGTGRVLFMDDDESICDITANMLESLDYKFDVAKNGAEAIALYKRYQNIGRPYDAVIMDLTIVGGMGGEECFDELKKIDPDVRAIIATGYDNDEMARQFMERGFCGYLSKPYRVGDLGKVLREVLG